MAICPKQARMLNLSNNQTHDATEKCVKNVNNKIPFRYCKMLSSKCSQILCV